MGQLKLTRDRHYFRVLPLKRLDASSELYLVTSLVFPYVFELKLTLDMLLLQFIQLILIGGCLSLSRYCHAGSLSILHLPFLYLFK